MRDSLTEGYELRTSQQSFAVGSVAAGGEIGAAVRAFEYRSGGRRTRSPRLRGFPLNWNHLTFRFENSARGALRPGPDGIKVAVLAIRDDGHGLLRGDGVAIKNMLVDSALHQYGDAAFTDVELIPNYVIRWRPAAAVQRWATGEPVSMRDQDGHVMILWRLVRANSAPNR